MCGLTGSLQYNINNMYMPNYRLDPISTYQLMCQSKNDNYSMDAGSLITSQEAFFNFMFVFMMRLNMPSEMGVRSLSGFDSRGLNSAFFSDLKESDAEASNAALVNVPLVPFKGTAAAPDNKSETFIIAECTSVCRVGQSRQIEIIV